MTTPSRSIEDGRTVDLATESVDFHPPTGTYRTEFDLVGRFPSEAVVNAVAHAAECGPIALPPLFSSVDPDALDMLFGPTSTGHTRARGSVSFDYAGHTVTVNGHGTVEVTPLDSRSE